jgi:hypothetical protein
MKKLLLSVALVGLAVACKSQATNVTDTSAATPECTKECATECATGCDTMKAECSDQKVCPATGKAIN